MMDQITHIMDISGFGLKNWTYLHKEMAIVEVATGNFIMTEFLLEKDWCELTPAEQASVQNDTKFHGIPFRDVGFEEMKQEDIYKVVETFLGNPKNCIVAHKGNVLVNRVLNKMKIREKFLSDLWCPTYEMLAIDPVCRTNLEVNMPCRLHSEWQSSRGRLYRCSFNVVCWSRLWLINKCRR
nr:uncharacterized protein LOC116433810 [Nomia melanderi]